MKLAIVQSEEEVKFIQNNILQKITFLPLNLESLTYLIINNYSFLSPTNFLPEKFHEETTDYVKNEINKLSLDEFTYHGIKIEYKGHIRFVLNYTILLIELLNSITKKKNIEEIVVSGWDSINILKHKSNNVFLITRIIKNINLKQKITILDKKQDVIKPKLIRYEIEKEKISKNKKKLLLNTVYYNFFRIIYYCRLLGIKTYVFEFNKLQLNLFKRIVYKILGLKIIKVKKTYYEKKELNLKKLLIIYKNINISKIVNLRISELEQEIAIIKNKMYALNNFLKNNFFNYYFTNIVRGFDGCVTDIINKFGTKTLCISHGTVSKYYNKFDKIYKQQVSEAVFSGPSQYFAIQTKICKDSLDNTNKEIKKPIITGNLLFGSIKKKKRGNFILYATTLKPFHGTRVLGDELYFEFFENLKDLEKFSKTNKFKILVNMHLSNKESIKNLRKLFPNIIFVSKKIDKVLKQSFVTISFSSSVIEDSLNSKIPVILFDKWKRYKHCDINENNNHKPIFYVNNLEELKEKIELIKKNSVSLDFDTKIFGKDIKSNVFQLFESLGN